MLGGKYNLLGASACVKLKRYEDAITWCDKGLAVSFLTSH